MSHGRLAAFVFALSIAVAGFAISATAIHAVPPAHPPALPTATQSQPLRWNLCGANNQDAQCATLRVPLDYAHPNGTKITVALERVLASDPAHRIGSLLVNPGGPGASAATFPLALRQAAVAAGGSAAEVFARFDVVGFDPRGVGGSRPLIECGSATDRYQEADFAPRTPREQRVLIAETRRFVRACAQSSGELLGFVDTTSVVRDIDQIREALGEPTISYLGYSYGTVLGAAYAHLFPNRVRAFVLDGAVNPDTVLDTVAGQSEQAGALDRAFQAFARDCVARPDCESNAGGDLVGAYDRLIASLADKPLTAQSQPGRMITQNEVVSTLAVALAQLPAFGPNIVAALAQAESGDASLIATGYDSFFERGQNRTNFLEANTAIDCIDARTPRGDAGYGALITRVQAQDPRFGQAFVSGYLPCAYWPTHAKPPRLSVPASAPPILVVGSTGDPLTPYEGVQSMANSIPSSVLLTRTGEGHGSYLLPPANPCIYDAISSYLLDDSPPPPGTTC